MSCSSHGFKRSVVFNLVAVQVNHRKAQVVVAPNQFAVFEAKRRKTVRVKPCTNIGVESVRKEGLEIYCLFGVVIESQMDAEVSNLFGSDNVDGGGCHLSLLVMRSGVMGLCSTKKSIHLAMMSSARALTISSKWRISLMSSGARPATAL